MKHLYGSQVVSILAQKSTVQTTSVLGIEEKCKFASKLTCLKLTSVNKLATFFILGGGRSNIPYPKLTLNFQALRSMLVISSLFMSLYFSCHLVYKNCCVSCKATPGAELYTQKGCFYFHICLQIWRQIRNTVDFIFSTSRVEQIKLIHSMVSRPSDL